MVGTGKQAQKVPLLILTLERSMVTDTFDSPLEEESQHQPSHSLKSRVEWSGDQAFRESLDHQIRHNKASKAYKALVSRVRGVFSIPR
jgi:hypothetical protein